MNLSKYVLNTHVCVSKLSSVTGKTFEVISGNIVLLGGRLNGGTQNIRTSSKVNISGTVSAVGTTINIGNSSSVFMADTLGAGTVNLMGVTASMYNVSTGKARLRA